MGSNIQASSRAQERNPSFIQVWKCNITSNGIGGHASVKYILLRADLRGYPHRIQKNVGKNGADCAVRSMKGLRKKLEVINGHKQGRGGLGRDAMATNFSGLFMKTFLNISVEVVLVSLTQQ